MKKISAETTRYMMDAMAYVFVGAVVAATGEEPTAQEIDSNVRAMMALYCRSEGIEPTYDNIASPANCEHCACCKRSEVDAWHDEEDDDDDWDDDDDEDYDDDDDDDDNEEEDTSRRRVTGAELLQTVRDYIEGWE